MRRAAWIATWLLGVAGLAALGYFGWQKWWKPAEPVYGGRTMSAWLEALRQDDPTEGARAARELAGLGEAGLPVLLEARRDADLRAHRRAVSALVQPGAAEELVEALPRGGARAALPLARLGPAAVPALERGLRDPEVAPHAARVLGEMGPAARAAVPALARLLADGTAKEATRVAAAVALGRVGLEKPDGAPEALSTDRTAEALTAALAGSPAVKVAAAQALGRLGPAAAVAAVPPLSQLARAADAAVATAACEALGRMATPSAAAPLLARLEAADAVSPVAALALARLGAVAPQAVPALISALKHPKSGQLVRAVLERLGPAAVPGLTAALGDPDAATRAGAAEVLGLLGPRAGLTLERLRELLADKDPAVALRAAQAMVRINPDRASPTLEVLFGLVQGKDERLAAEAAAVLPDLGAAAGKKVPELLGLLRSKDERRVALAADVLARIRPTPPGTVAALATLPRPACVQALGRLGPRAKGAAPALLAALKDPVLRPHAALALTRVDAGQGTAAVAALAPDLAAGGPARLAALAALAEMDPVPMEAVGRLRTLLGEPTLAPTLLRILERTDRRALVPVVPDLMTLLGATDPATREQAITLLRRAGDRARTELMAAAAAAAPTVRTAALDGLTGWPLPPGQSARVVARLGDADESVRRAAAALLASQQSPEPEVVEALQALTSRDEAELRRAGAWGLRHAAAADATPYLLECLADPDADVRRVAVDSLAAADAAEAIRPLLRDPSSGVRFAAVRALDRLESGKKDDLPGVLVALGKEAAPDGRGAVLEVLLTADAGRARQLLPELEADVRGAEVPDRVAAAGWLARLDEAAAARMVPFLEGVLNGWGPDARAAAALELGRIGPPARGAVPALKRRLELDDDTNVRLAARHALTQLAR